MKKITLLFGLIILLISCQQSKLDSSDEVSGVNEFFEYENFNKIYDPGKIRYCEKEEVCLWAGQHIDAGSVIIGNDDKYLYVTVNSDEGFQNVSENVKIEIYTDLPDKRPSTGNFNYKTTVPDGDTTVTLQIPLSDLTDEGDADCTTEMFYVLAHADVIANGKGETAWGGCNDGKEEDEEAVAVTNGNANGGGAWWYYIEYSPGCCTCWCAFGNDYGNSDDGSCFIKPFQGTDFTFWSNEYNFETIGEAYTISLLVGSIVCDPQDKNGNIDPESMAWEVGKVLIEPYMHEGKMVADITYTLNDRYAGYNIQFDLYIGSTRVPNFDLAAMIIIEDETHKLHQFRVTPGDVTHTFMAVPWLTDGSSSTYIATHAAIGDCPMPSLQSPI